MPNTFPKFDKYVCVGDKITWNFEGFDFVATVHQDSVSSIDDCECYDEKDIAAFKDDAWFYCGILISVSKNGIELCQHAASLWGIDCNFPGSDNSNLSEAAQEMQGEALEEAKKELKRFIKALQE